MAIGERIAKIRKAKGLSQDQFAAEIDVSRSAYQYYERNERDLPSSVLNQIVTKFNDDPNRLLNGEPSPKLMEILEFVVIAVFEYGVASETPIAPTRLWRVVARVIATIYAEYSSLDDVVINRDEIKALVEMVA